MEETHSFSRKQIALWAALAAMAAIGVVASVFADKLPWNWAEHLANELGGALFTAAVLGFTVDRFLKTEIIRDVFQAAFKYILPAELKREIERVIRYTFVCDKHVMVVEIERRDKHTVYATVSIERRLKNITRHNQNVVPFFGLDEWGFGEKSKILECKAVTDTGLETSFSAEILEGVHRVYAKTDELTIRPGHSFTVYYKAIEISRSNGALYYDFRAPTLNPEIEVRKPADIDYYCSFGSEDDSEKLAYIERHTMRGTYFPSHIMRIRWWPKQQ